MLAIRPEQFEQLQKAAVEEFKTRLLKQLIDVLPRNGIRSLSVDQLRVEIDEGMERGPRYRIRTEQELSVYIEAVCMYLGGFEPGGHSKPVRAILNDHRMNLDEKMAKLATWAKERERAK